MFFSFSWPHFSLPDKPTAALKPQTNPFSWHTGGKAFNFDPRVQFVAH